MLIFILLWWNGEMVFSISLWRNIEFFPILMWLNSEMLFSMFLLWNGEMLSSIFLWWNGEMYPHNYKYSTHEGSSGVSSAWRLDPFRTLMIEVYNSFGFRQHVFFDSVSCSLCVDAQHCKGSVSCNFDWWCLWWLHFFVAGKLLGLINRVNIVVASLYLDSTL